MNNVKWRRSMLSACLNTWIILGHHWNLSPDIRFAQLVWSQISLKAISSNLFAVNIFSNRKYRRKTLQYMNWVINNGVVHKVVAAFVLVKVPYCNFTEENGLRVFHFKRFLVLGLSQPLRVMLIKQKIQGFLFFYFLEFKVRNKAMMITLKTQGASKC